MTHFNYQIGGSLPHAAPSYISRAADQDLYEALRRGEFCYVLNSRQMGKSSLLVKMSHQLRQAGAHCVTLDMTRIGSDIISPEQWYKSLATELWDGFNLHDTIDLKAWWRELGDLSLPLRLSRFLDLILLTSFPHNKIVIFVDEIDSILSLNFSVDDFFALIRSFYNQRSLKPDYQRLTFALFGVATPSDLIQDRQKTPFNIGQAIALQGLQVEDAQSLAQGFNTLNHPQLVLNAVLDWTGGQPFLTQKLCYLIQTQVSQNQDLSPEDEILWVEQIVRSHFIDHWETQDDPEHLRTICDRIQRNGARIGRILEIYQQVLMADPPTISMDHSREQSELLLSGLVVQHQGTLIIKNRLYAEVFNQAWIQAQLQALRPYSQGFEEWIASNQLDESRLLRGQALRDAQAWSQGKSLSDLDYQFISKSEALDRRVTQQTLVFDRSLAIKAQLSAEKKNVKLQKLLLGGMSFALLCFVMVGALLWQQNRQLMWREIAAIATSSEALLNSGKDLEAMIAAMKATRKLQSINHSDSIINQQVQTALRRAVYQTYQYNSFSGHTGTIRTLAFSPDGNAIATASVDNTTKIWRSDGSLMTTLKGHKAAVSTVEFSPDGEILVTTSEDNTAKLWHVDGTLITTLKGHTSSVWDADFSPDGQILVTCSGDRTLKLWQRDGTLIKTFDEQPSSIFGVAFSPDGEAIATSNSNNSVDLWQLDGTLLRSFGTQEGRVNALEFSPDGQIIAATNVKGILKLWSRDGELLNTIEAHSGLIPGLDFSADGQQLVTGSSDETVKLWQRDGTLLKTYKGHAEWVSAVGFHPNSKTLASAGYDSTVRLWNIEHPLVAALSGHRSAVVDVEFSPDGKTIASSSKDTTVKLWERNGRLIQTLREHRGTVWKVLFSPDGKRLATASEDGIVKLWQFDTPLTGSLNISLIYTLQGHLGGAWGGAFSPDGKSLAIASGDGAVKIWGLDGTLIRTLKGHKAPVWKVTYSPDGLLLATASGDGVTKIWQRNGKEITSVSHEGAAIFGVTFSPDSSILATTSGDSVVKLWPLNNQGQVKDGQVVATMKDHDAPVFSAAFSPDGQTLATVSEDNSLRLWEFDGNAIVTLEKHQAGIMGVNFSPDGQMIATASNDKTVLLWDLKKIDSLDLFAYGCDQIKDYLTTNANLEKSEQDLCD